MILCSWQPPIGYNYIPMRQSTKKALNYANEIRRSQRNQIITTLRSKMLGNVYLDFRGDMEQDQLGTSAISQQNAHKPASQYNRILTILTSIRRQQENEINSGITSYGCDIIQYILTCRNDQSFQFQYVVGDALPQSVEMTVTQFKGCLDLLPKFISQLITQININLTRIRSCKIDALRDSQVIFKKISQCSDIKTLTHCLGGYLQAYARVIQRAKVVEECGMPNYSLLQAVTDCLIETSCFKPRQLEHYELQSEQLLLLGKVINSEMAAIKQVINGELCLLLLTCITLFRQREESLKLFTNYIYIIGNVFISLQTRQKQHKPQHFAQLHGQVLKKFDSILMEVHGQMALTRTQQVLQVEEILLQLASLMIWFVRNQILIRQGMFDGEKLTTSTNLGSVSCFLHIIFGVFTVLRSILNVKYSKTINPVIDFSQTTLIVDGLSLMQIIYFDFTINRAEMHEAVRHLIAFRQLLSLQAKHHEPLQQKIFGFYFALACSGDNGEWMQEIALEAQCGLAYGLAFPGVVRFAAKIIQPESKLFAKYKVAIFDKICSSIDENINSARDSPNVQKITALLFLIYSAIRQKEHVQQISNKAFPLLNEKRIACVLQLCGLLWEEEPRNENLIESLQLIKLLVEQEAYAARVKEIMESQGYYQQMEVHSLNQNEDVNRLVYEITELLEIY